MKRNSENCKLRNYKDKKMPSEVHEDLYQESHRWLQFNIEPKKVASPIAVQEHIVETWVQKVESDKWWICRQAKESNPLVIKIYKSSCNRISEKTQQFANDTLCDIGLYGLLVQRNVTKKVGAGYVIDSGACKFCWDFEYHLGKTISAR